MVRTFSVDDIKAIRNTHDTIMKYWNPEMDKETPEIGLARWHALNQSQIFVIFTLEPLLSDKQIIERLHLVTEAHPTVEDVLDIYDIDIEDYKKLE